ncbi:MAG TPA: orotidine-5'-phosphate decarboxylase [Patescibacteria group bacterium]|jgi:orotidine-5'-phosphate decarboxylase
MNAVLKKYQQRVDKINSLVCVGLDSDLKQIPDQFLRSKTPQFEFNRDLIEKTHQYAVAYKPNLAFYEARGAQGLAELKLTLSYLHNQYPEIVTIADAKRGDIGSSNEAYATALFDHFGFDAVTLNPYLGQEALRPFLDRTDRVSILLCRTSNPGAGEFQDLKINAQSLWQVIAEKISREWNKNDNCWLVVGATYTAELAQVRKIVGNMTLLVPGVGAQGGDVEKTLEAGLNAQGKGLVINSSRSIIFAENPGKQAQLLRDQINQYR